MGGTVYLLHFDEPLAHAKHYMGWVEGNLERRLAQHRSGRSGARLMEVVSERGIGFRLARTWKGERSEERRLKRCKDAPRRCPICKSQLRLKGVSW